MEWSGNREFTQFCERHQDQNARSRIMAPSVLKTLPEIMTLGQVTKETRPTWVEKLLARSLQNAACDWIHRSSGPRTLDREIYTMVANMGGSTKMWRLSDEA